MIVSPEQAASIRRLDCRSYNSCLTDAAEAGWSGFSCRMCKAYEPLSSDDKRRDVDGIADMFFARTDLMQRWPEKG